MDPLEGTWDCPGERATRRYKPGIRADQGYTYTLLRYGGRA